MLTQQKIVESISRENEIRKYAVAVWQTLRSRGMELETGEWNLIITTVAILWDLLDEETICLPSEPKEHS